MCSPLLIVQIHYKTPNKEFLWRMSLKGKYGVVPYFLLGPRPSQLLGDHWFRSQCCESPFPDRKLWPPLWLANHKMGVWDMWIVLCKLPLLLEMPVNKVCSQGWLEAGRVAQLAGVKALTPFSLVTRCSLSNFSAQHWQKLLGENWI